MFSTFLLSFTLLNSAEALPFGDDEAKKKKAEEIEAEEKAEEAAKNAKAARVVVLKWQNTTTDHNDGTLKLNVQSAISRTNVTFLPAIDLYQGGRELKDRTIPPSDQPAKVPSSVVGKIQSLVQDTASIRYDQLDSNQWAEKARTLRELAEEIWFVDRIELREPLFLLYTEIGRSADNVSEFQMGAPFYEYIGATQLNYYQYLAATLAEQEPALMEKLDDPDTVAQVEFYLEQIRQGVFPTMRIDFQMEDVFKKEKFDKQYEILFNGLPVQVDELGQKEILLGRTDIYLKDKNGGHGLTDRLEAIKTDEKSYSVLDDARKRMTIDFVKQLFLFENECKPKVDNDILTYLSIYAKMHPQVQEEIYIAVPKNGNPNKVWVWRYDVETTSLNKVASGNDNFPVHFVGLLNTGFTYTGATAGLAEIEPSDLVGLSPEDLLELDTVPGAVPISLELRVHYTRFMVNFGMEFGYNPNSEGWMEEKTVYEADGTEFSNDTYVFETFNQTAFLGLGYLFGKDASYGIGPRAAVRFAFTNVPNTFSPTGHFGWTMKAPGLEDFHERVGLVVDADFRLGAIIPMEGSILGDTVSPVFGLTAGAGITF